MYMSGFSQGNRLMSLSETMTMHINHFGYHIKEIHIEGMGGRFTEMAWEEHYR